MRKILNRFKAPASVQAAKDAATRLQESLSLSGLKVSRAQSLEAIARVCDARDWNTLKADLSQPDPKPDISAEEAKIMRYFALAPGKEIECIERVISFCGLHPNTAGHDMWAARAVHMCTGSIMLFHRLHVHCGREMTLEGFRRSFVLGCEGGIMDLYRQAKAAGIEDEVLSPVRDFFDRLPGFSYEKMMAGELQDSRSVEQQGYLALHFTKKIGDLIDC